MFDFIFFWVYGRKKHDKYCVYHNAWKEWFVKQKHNLCIYDDVCKNIKAFGTMHENCHRRLTWVKQRKLKVSNIFTCRFIFFFVFFFSNKEYQSASELHGAECLNKKRPGIDRVSWCSTEFFPIVNVIALQHSEASHSASSCLTIYCGYKNCELYRLIFTRIIFEN